MDEMKQMLLKQAELLLRESEWVAKEHGSEELQPLAYALRSISDSYVELVRVEKEPGILADGVTPLPKSRWWDE